MSDSERQSSDYFSKLYQGRALLAEFLDKESAIINSIRITSDYPSEKNKVTRNNLYIVGEIKLFPFDDATELSNLYKKFDELSFMLEKKGLTK